jgi:hypothetical protein
MAILQAPESGVTVRMYRQGHGDCYLLAFPNEKENGDPVHVLIDCGYKPGSENFIKPNTNPDDILTHIQESTGKKLDLVIVTHEHQDHVNLFNKKGPNNRPYFSDFEIRNAWFAWTESPTDRLAKRLRTKHRDVLVELVNARNQMAAMGLDSGDNPTLARLDALLELELGDTIPPTGLQGFAASSFAVSGNKGAMKVVKDGAGENISFLSPGQSVKIPSTKVRAYVLGPPRRETLLTDEDPIGDENFPRHLDARGRSFGAAVGKGGGTSPFSSIHAVDARTALTKKWLGGYFLNHYGKLGLGDSTIVDGEAPSNADWRRIDEDWLYSSEQIALKLNEGVNNTSLVLAFELPRSKRVLLFVGDAQRGNWISWPEEPFLVGDRKVTTRDLLARTVLYKVGHHGSHNATLAGEADSEYPNLSWMGDGEFGEEFVAMINAVNLWAIEQTPPWHHPLESIKTALHQKSQGRVFQTDTPPQKPGGSEVPAAVWKSFKERTVIDDLYFDYMIEDD